MLRSTSRDKRPHYQHGLVMVTWKWSSNSCKTLAYSLPVDEGELLKDLNKNFMVKKELGMIVYRFSLNYGKYMAITVLLFSLSIMLKMMRHIPQKNLIRTWQVID